MPDPDQITIRRPGQPPAQITIRRAGQDAATLPPKALTDLADAMSRRQPTFDLSAEALMDPSAGEVFGSRPERGLPIVLPLAAGTMTGGLGLLPRLGIEAAAAGGGRGLAGGTPAEMGRDAAVTAGLGLAGHAVIPAAVRGGQAVLRIARGPSTAVAAREATLAERVAEEATARARATAKAEQAAAQDALKLQRVEAENAAARLTHEENQAARSNAAFSRYSASKAQHEAAEATRVARETAAREQALALAQEQQRAVASHVADTQQRLERMTPTNIVTDRAVEVAGSPSGLINPSTELQTTQFQLPSQATRETSELGRKMALLRRAGIAPPPNAMPGAPPSTANITVPDLPEPPRPFRAFTPPARTAFEPAAPPTPTTLPAYTPRVYPDLPPVTGPQTRGGELTMDAVRQAAPYAIGGTALSPFAYALYKLWKD